MGGTTAEALTGNGKQALGLVARALRNRDVRAVLVPRYRCIIDEGTHMFKDASEILAYIEKTQRSTDRSTSCTTMSPLSQCLPTTRARTSPTSASGLRLARRAV